MSKTNPSEPINRITIVKPVMQLFLRQSSLYSYTIITLTIISSIVLVFTVILFIKGQISQEMVKTVVFVCATIVSGPFLKLSKQQNDLLYQLTKDLTTESNESKKS